MNTLDATPDVNTPMEWLQRFSLLSVNDYRNRRTHPQTIDQTRTLAAEGKGFYNK